MNEITVNWHIIQKCNYKCYYCFAKYGKNNKKEIHCSKKEIELLLNKVYQSFKNEFKGYSIRLNIAGGEPTLSKNLNFIIQTAYKIGFDVSIITNSSVLTTRFISENAKYLSMFAISIDSLNKDTNLKIGRIGNKNFLEIHHVLKNISLLRKYNNSIKIKINTVINNYNYTEYIGDFINLAKPDKWKIFQALNINNSSSKEYCSKEQFKTFINNHKDLNINTFSETNEEMIESYIMIDPYGRFYQNSGAIYQYSKSILELESNEIINHVNFDLKKYKNRY
ncbi:viperin family antiviral radical SAM protein [Aliarcobacter butzleri]|uniref:viperin family antiviral radical SAM protein n=1 Tax=Aliarcobacter butzleri TaxID=28197 RepID=UPI003B20C0E7